MNIIQIDHQKAKKVSIVIGNNKLDDTTLFWLKPSIQLTCITLMSVHKDTSLAVNELQFGYPLTQTITQGVKVTHQFMLFGNTIYIINEQNSSSDNTYHNSDKNYLISQQDFNKAIVSYIQPLKDLDRLGVSLKKSSILVIPDIFLGGKKQSITPPNTRFLLVGKWFWSTHTDIEDQYKEYIIGQTIDGTMCVNEAEQVIDTAKNAWFIQTGQYHIVQHATTNEVKVIDVSKDKELDNRWTIIYSCSIPDQELINSVINKASNDNNFNLIVEKYLTKTSPRSTALELIWIGPNNPTAITSYLHYTADTPFGEFRILVKRNSSNTSLAFWVDKIPGSNVYLAFGELDEAKAYCQTQYKQKFESCVNQPIDTTSTLKFTLQELSSFIFKHEESFVNHFYGWNGWTELVRLTYNETHCYFIILNRADETTEHSITWADFQQWTELLM